MEKDESKDCKGLSETHFNIYYTNVYFKFYSHIKISNKNLILIIE